MSTKRTILSPFTKEYRVLATYSGIRPFLEGSSTGINPYSSKSEIFLQYSPDNDMTGSVILKISWRLDFENLLRTFFPASTYNAQPIYTLSHVWHLSLPSLRWLRQPPACILKVNCCCATILISVISMGFPGFPSPMSYQFISKTNLYIYCFAKLQIPYYWKLISILLKQIQVLIW